MRALVFVSPFMPYAIVIIQCDSGWPGPHSRLQAGAYSWQNFIKSGSSSSVFGEGLWMTNRCRFRIFFACRIFFFWIGLAGSEISVISDAYPMLLLGKSGIWVGLQPGTSSRPPRFTWLFHRFYRVTVNLWTRKNNLPHKMIENELRSCADPPRGTIPHFTNSCTCHQLNGSRRSFSHSIDFCDAAMRLFPFVVISIHVLELIYYNQQMNNESTKFDCDWHTACWIQPNAKQTKFNSNIEGQHTRMLPLLNELRYLLICLLHNSHDAIGRRWPQRR